MTSGLRSAGVALALLLLGGVASAQYTAKKLVFSNPGPYPQQDLEALAGMHVGQTFTQDDLGAAVQRISDSTYFVDVTASLEGPFKAMTVSFKLTPVAAEQLVRASFDNLVWFTPEELSAAIRARIPIFRGFLPVSGATVEKATDALQETVTAKGITQHILHNNFEPAFGHPDRVIQFTAVGHPILLRAAEVKGGPVGMQAAEDKQIAALKGKRYSEGLAGQPTAELLLAPYADAGYIDAKFTDFLRTVADTPQTTDVSVSAAVDAGSVYRVSSVTYAGSETYSSADFAKTAKLHPEDVASRKLLRETLAPIDEAYRNKGYLDAVAEAVPVRDEATHHVAYTVTETPGEVYRLKSVTAVGLSAAAQRDFDRGWLMKVGDIYSPGYAADFLKQNTALQALAGYSAAFKASADPETHLVDLSIRFAGSGR